MVRIPRGFVEDLSSVIFKHDVLFLETVCRELNIPFREAKNKVLGLGEGMEADPEPETVGKRDLLFHRFALV